MRIIIEGKHCGQVAYEVSDRVHPTGTCEKQYAYQHKEQLLQDGRTYVVIRFVANARGGCNDVPEHIKRSLRDPADAEAELLDSEKQRYSSKRRTFDNFERIKDLAVRSASPDTYDKFEALFAAHEVELRQVLARLEVLENIQRA